MLIIKENYADERRTEIRHAEGEIDMRDLIDDEEIIYVFEFLTVSFLNYTIFSS